MRVNEMKMENVLVTGTAGFIGYHLSKYLLDKEIKVVGMDNLNPYYDVGLKKARLRQLSDYKNFTFCQLDLSDTPGMETLFRENAVDVAVHLAAQAGVRYSIKNPRAYIDSNLVGTLNVLEGCRNHHVKHLVFASSSSVYGANRKMPFSVHDNVDHPVSLYAATKKSNELMAHAYSHLYGLNCTGLRFFTVYGPWGRPDMALFLFTEAILNQKPIQIFNNGEMKRDFTYIDDIVEGVFRVMAKPPVPNPKWDAFHPDPGTSNCPYKIYNIGNNNPVDLMTFIVVLENVLGATAKKEFLGMQPGDVPATYADVEDLIEDVGFRPETSIETGISNFVSWYKKYYGA
jgi:UDP-glucuronate 4-epimerase